MTIVFATGTTGTIGSYLSPEVKPLNIRLEENFKDNFLRVFKPGSRIIHLAATVGHGNKKMNENAFSINVSSSVKLAKYAIDSNAEQFIFISSAHVYGCTDGEWKESSALSPVNPYGKQKAQAEMALTELFGGTKTSLVILRLFSILDWGMNPLTLGGRVERIYKHNSKELIPCSDDIRDFMTPKTASNAIEKISKSDISPGVYNICTSNAKSVAKAVEELGNSVGIKKQNCFIPGFSEMPSIKGSNKKILSEIPDLNLTWDYES